MPSGSREWLRYAHYQLAPVESVHHFRATKYSKATVDKDKPEVMKENETDRKPELPFPQYYTQENAPCKTLHQKSYSQAQLQNIALKSEESKLMIAMQKAIKPAENVPEKPTLLYKKPTQKECFLMQQFKEQNTYMKQRINYFDTLLDPNAEISPLEISSFECKFDEQITYL